MALTGPRIVASIYGGSGPSAQSSYGVQGRSINLAFGEGVSFYDQVQTASGVTCNSVIEVQPSGVQQHKTRYFSVQTSAQIISGGA